MGAGAFLMGVRVAIGAGVSLIEAFGVGIATTEVVEGSWVLHEEAGVRFCTKSLVC